jgi:hypothetical protein
MAAWGWQKGEGEGLIKRYGLPLMEQALKTRGWRWSAQDRAWLRAYNQTRERAA